MRSERSNEFTSKHTCADVNRLVCAADNLLWDATGPKFVERQIPVFGRVFSHQVNLIVTTVSLQYCDYVSTLSIRELSSLS